MPKLTQRLADLEIRNVKANGKTQLLHDGGGLYCRVGPGGSKCFVYRYSVGTKDHWMTLGSYPRAVQRSLHEA